MRQPSARALRQPSSRQLASRPSDVLRQSLNAVRRALQQELTAFSRARLEAKAQFFTAGPRRQGLQFWQAIRRWFRGPVYDCPPLQVSDGGMASSPEERAEVFAAHLQGQFGGTSDDTFDEAFYTSTEEQVAADADASPRR